MDHGGYEGAKTTQEVKKTAYDDYRPATDKHVPDAVAGPGASVEGDLQRAIRKNPADKGSYLKLSEIYRKQKEFDKAEEVLQKAFESTGSADYNIRQIIEDVELERRRHEIELGRAIVKDEAGKRNIEALKRELHQREIEILTTRVERYPMDAGLKYELATRLMKSKDYKKAIPLLQQATVDQRREAKVRVALGKCFIAEKQIKLALYQFEKSVEKINAHDDPELYCEAHYILGRLCEDEGDQEKAEKHFSDVLSVNYSFKDGANAWSGCKKGAGNPRATSKNRATRSHAVPLSTRSHAIVVGRLGGLGRFDLLLEIDVGDPLVEFDSEAAGLLFLRSGGRAGDAALGFRRGTGNANHVPALGADPLFARVFVADFEGALARRAEDEDCHGFPILYARCRLIAVGDVPILEKDADNGKCLNRPMLIWVG